ncbi:MAG TPA: TylF/MycF/NovP-related O-methyltransferase [Candidatus Sulfotelmatobacter sp.]|jgi:tetratricopeptide (TPR) repeat protein|nr:TylF/MycF/NovP-related O-methyltransferase [Candidatus Sulfotelmatobacter sp.]
MPEASAQFDVRQVTAMIRDMHARQQYEQARDLSHQALSQLPNNAELLYLAAVSEMMSGRPDLALPILEKAMAIEPNNVQHLRAVLASLKALKRNDEALGVAERAIALMLAQPVGLEPAAIARRTVSHHLQARPHNIVHHRRSRALGELTEMFLNSPGYHVDDLARLYLFYDNISRALSRGVTGDMAEFGVWKGHTAKALKGLVPGRMLYLFDSFAGFPAGSFPENDRRYAMFKDCSLEAVRDFVGNDQVVWRPGTFPATAEGLSDNLRFSVVHIDFGSGPGTGAALDFAYSRLNSGGVLFLHDYANDSWAEVARTADAFLADKPEKLMVAPDKGGTGVLIKR